MVDISDMVETIIAAQNVRQKEADKRPKILPEAAIMRIKEFAASYAEQLKGTVFKIGDIVTPRSGSSLKGVNDPHIVIEVRFGTEPDFSRGDVLTVEHGLRLDMRVLSVQDDWVAAHWVESYVFEHWEKK